MRHISIQYHKKFKKQYYLLPQPVQAKFDKRLRLFIKDPYAPQLRIHPLKGRFVGYWSINITGDVRAIYRQHGDTIIIFVLIGTHSQLY